MTEEQLKAMLDAYGYWEPSNPAMDMKMYCHDSGHHIVVVQAPYREAQIFLFESMAKEPDGQMRPVETVDQLEKLLNGEEEASPENLPKNTTW